MRLPLLVLTLVALAAGPASAERTRAKHHKKPSAPVTLTAVAERGPDGWQVVVDAVPTRDVAAVELEVDGQRIQLGAGKARRGHHLVVPVAAPAAGKDVVVAARAGGRSTAVNVRVGAPAAQAPKQPVTIRVVNGVTIAEVR